RVIVPVAAAGPTDVFARLITNKLSEILGKQFYVENIGGAGGNICVGQAAKKPSHGYTILIKFVRRPTAPFRPRFLLTLQGFRSGRLGSGRNECHHSASVVAGEDRQRSRGIHQG